MQLSLQVDPDMFNGIKVWAVGWVVIHRDLVVLKKLADNLGLMNWRIVLLKSSTRTAICSIASSWYGLVDVVNDR